MQSAFRRTSLSTLALILLTASGCASGDVTATTNTPPPSNPATETYASSLGINLASMTKISDNLYIQDVVVGTGAVTLANHALSVTYTGWLVNGTQFDSNVGGSAFQFVFGTGKVIAGWDQGLIGMRVGGTRRLVIGSTLGYGAASSGAIPPSSTLVFTVQLTSEQ